MWSPEMMMNAHAYKVARELRARGAGVELHRPGVGGKSWLVHDKADPTFMRRLRESTVDALFDMDLWEHGPYGTWTIRLEESR